MKKRILVLSMLVALVGVLITPMAVLADTTDITGTVPVVVEVIAPVDFAMASLTPVNSPITSSAQTANVSANKAWTLNVKESGGGEDGKMYSTSGNLTAEMTVTGGDEGAYVSLATPGADLETAGVAGGAQLISDIYFRQAVAWTDIPGNYSITVVFTASPIA